MGFPSNPLKKHFGRGITPERPPELVAAYRVLKETKHRTAGHHRAPSGTRCPAIDGLIKEADETAGEIEDKSVLDGAIVANAQAVEHYEICRYGTLIAWAEALGHDEIVRFLTTNLNEEHAANTKLNSVALRKGVNTKASNAA